MTEENIVGSDEVLQFWFGDAGESAEALGRRARAWFTPDRAMDEEISERFATTLKAAGDGKLDHWAASPRGRLALIVVLDQFSRHIHRGSARAFQHDAMALACCLEGIDGGDDKTLGTLERSFFYRPLQHAEDRELQALSVKHYSSLLDECAEEHEHFHRKSLKNARQHRDIVERFGRYPHRNRALGRANSEEEDQYLAGDAPTFGQKQRHGTR